MVVQAFQKRELAVLRFIFFPYFACFIPPLSNPRGFALHLGFIHDDIIFKRKNRPPGLKSPEGCDCWAQMNIEYITTLDNTCKAWQRFPGLFFLVGAVRVDRYPPSTLS